VVVTVYPPLTEFLSRDQARHLADQGLFGDTAGTLRVAWTNVDRLWTAALEVAKGLPPAALDESVNGEWSFIQTLRHLVFVVDSWLGEVVQGQDRPHHRLGLPPHFLADRARQLSLDVDARPSLDEVVAAWSDRSLRVDTFLRTLTDEEMTRTCAAIGGKFQVAGAVQTLVSEAWAHHEFAMRDLAIIRGSAG
jgi:hypothetical protein